MVSDPMGLQLFMVVSCWVELGIEPGPSGGVQGVLNTEPSYNFLKDIFILRYIDENISWALQNI